MNSEFGSLDKIGRVPKVLVLLASFNGEEYISEQIETIILQQGVDVEILVGDDFSSDGTVEIVKEYCRKFPQKIGILTETKIGSASGNFFRLIMGADYAGFDYVALCDQDDLWFENKLATSISIAKSESADAVSSDVLTFSNSSRKQKVLRKSLPQRKYDHWFESPGPGCTHLYSSDLAIELKEFCLRKRQSLDLIDFHDWLFYSFVRENGFRWHIIPQTTMKYRQHDNNVFGANSSFSSKVRRLRLLMEGWHFHQVKLIYELVTGNSFSRIERQFFLKNMFDIRRSRFQAFIISVFYLIFLSFLKKKSDGKRV